MRKPQALIVLCDGSWQSRDTGSNIGRLFRVLPDTSTQQVYYHPGVGTRWFDQVRGGVWGLGLSRNVRDAWSWLAKRYTPGDRIILVGYSRGAYTARSLAGMIGRVRSFRLTPAAAWRNYRAKRSIGSAWPEPLIHLVMCIDTVGALGVPGGPITRRATAFHDVKLGEHVKAAFHLCAAHERRKAFRPTHWESSRAETLWFRGDHGDVGQSDRVLAEMIGRLRMLRVEVSGATVPGRVSRPASWWRLARGLAWRDIHVGQVDLGAIEAAKRAHERGDATPADQRLLEQARRYWREQATSLESEARRRLS